MLSSARRVTSRLWWARQRAKRPSYAPLWWGRCSTTNNDNNLVFNQIDVKINKLERFDIVVIETGDTYIIKRVIGLPGETIKYQDGKLYINGKKMKDPYYKNENTSDFESVKIPENHYYVLGDNRSDSIDSRIIGPVSLDNIKGTTKLVIFPFNISVLTLIFLLSVDMNPINVNLSVLRPDIESAVTVADGPGIPITLILFSLASFACFITSTSFSAG